MVPRGRMSRRHARLLRLFAAFAHGGDNNHGAAAHPIIIYGAASRSRVSTRTPASPPTRCVFQILTVGEHFRRGEPDRAHSTRCSFPTKRPRWSTSGAAPSTSFLHHRRGSASLKRREHGCGAHRAFSYDASQMAASNAVSSPRPGPGSGSRPSIIRRAPRRSDPRRGKSWRKNYAARAKIVLPRLERPIANALDDPHLSLSGLLMDSPISMSLVVRAALKNWLMPVFTHSAAMNCALHWQSSQFSALEFRHGPQKARRTVSRSPPFASAP